MAPRNKRQVVRAVNAALTDAKREVRATNPTELHFNEALRWAARANAAYGLSIEASGMDEKAGWLQHGEAYRAEALHHSGLVDDAGWLLRRVYNVIESRRSSAVSELM